MQLSNLIVRAFVLVLLVSAISSRAAAQEPSETPASPPAGEAAGQDEQLDEPVEDPAHDKLRALRDGLTEAINSGNTEGIFPFLHDDVVIVWQDGRTVRGHDEVRAYMSKMLEGPDKKVESFGVDPTVAALTILYGDDTGISYGTQVSHFVLTGGHEVDIDGPWSSTLVKLDDDRWVIASFHSSAGLFDNPLLNLAKRMTVIVGVIAAVAGLVLGIVVMAMIKRKPRAGTAG